MASDPLHDFSNPIMAAAIVKPDDTRYPLWVAPRGSAADIYESELPGVTMLTITDLIVELGLNYIPKISATISLPFDDLIALLQATAGGKGISWLQDNIECQFGYVDSNGKATLSPPFVAFLDKPEVNIGEEATVGLTGIGTAGWSSSRQGRGQAFNQKTRFEIIEELLKGPDKNNPRSAEVDSEAVRFGPGPGSPPFKALFTKKVTISPGWSSDYHMILRIAKECFCWVRFDYDGDKKKDIARLIPFSAVLEAPKHRFQMFGGLGKFGPGTGLYPILSFNSPTTGVYYASEARGKYLAAINSETGEFEATYLGDDDKEGAEPTNKTGKGGGKAKGTPKTPEPDEKKGAGVAPAQADQPTEEAINRVRAESVKAMNTGLGVKIEIETLGVPDLLPGALIQIVGLSDLFNANYRVFNVTHSLGTGGYSTSIVAQSNTALVTQQVVAQIAGNLNAEPADIEETKGNTTKGGAG